MSMLTFLNDSKLTRALWGTMNNNDRVVHAGLVPAFELAQLSSVEAMERRCVPETPIEIPVNSSWVSSRRLLKVAFYLRHVMRVIVNCLRVYPELVHKQLITSEIITVISRNAMVIVKSAAHAFDRSAHESEPRSSKRRDRERVRIHRATEN